MNIGLHIRLTKNLTDIIEKALFLQIPFFQTFFTLQNGKYIQFDYADVNNFLKLRRKHFNELYLHGSYWINLCMNNAHGYKALEKELLMAKKLEFTHIVLHPGSASDCKDKAEGMRNLANALNKILKQENEIKIVLENTAHANMSIGGDLNDFRELLQLIDKPEKIYFCIDTAHAYSFGYDLQSDAVQQNFINELFDIFKENVILIHLNDTNEKIGLKIDKHTLPGEGNIGKIALQKFINHEKLKDIAILLEPPIMPIEDEKKLIDQIKIWKTF